MPLPVLDAPSRSSEGTGEDASGEQEAIHRRAARTTWALLLARIDEVFPLVCPRCGSEMQDATLGEDDPRAQSAPEYDFDQRVAW